MKKFVLAAMLAISLSVHAQDTGAAAANGNNAGTNSNWDKWAFTAGGVLAVAGGLASLFAVGANGSDVTVTVPAAQTSH